MAGLTPISTVRVEDATGVEDALPESPITPYSNIMAFEHEDCGKPPQVIVSVMTVAHPPSFAALEQHLERTLMRHKRMNKVLDAQRGVWVQPPTPAAAADQIVQASIAADTELVADPVANGGSLMRYVEEQMMLPLRTDRPAWEVHLVSFEGGGGGPAGGGRTRGALVWKIHHAIGDGVSLASLLLRITEPLSGEGGGDSGPPAPAAAPAPAPVGWARRAVRGLSAAAATAAATVRGLAAITKLLAFPEPRSVLKKTRRGGLGPLRVAISAPISVAGIKRARAAAGGGATVNDVLVTAVARSLRLVEARHPRGLVPGVEPAAGVAGGLRGIIIVNVRPVAEVVGDIDRLLGGGELGYWGNKVGFTCFTTPRGEELESVQSSVAAIRGQFSAMKISYVPLIMFYATALVLRALGSWAVTQLLFHLCHNSTIGFSNVMGPPSRVSFAGAEVTGLLNFVTGMPHGANYHVLSYAGDVRLAVCSHVGTVPDPSVLTGCFEEAIEEVLAAYNVH